VLVTCLALPVTADAAKRKVPFGFFGSVLPPAMPLIGSTQLDQQMSLMARSGVESVRVTRAWNDVEPANGRYTLAQLDRVIGTAAKHGIEVIVNVTTTPKWAAAHPNNHDYYRLPPKSNALFAAMWRELTLRYGNSGTFWQQNPTIPKRPVTQWQIWNEPNSAPYWRPAPDPAGYADLLAAAATAIHTIDPDAVVVAGGLVSGHDRPWVMDPRDFVTTMLAARPDLRGIIGAVGLHSYAPTAAETMDDVESHLTHSREAVRAALDDLEQAFRTVRRERLERGRVALP